MSGNLCSKCFKGINNKGSPLVVLLEDVVEIFWILEQPVAIMRDSIIESLIEYLERNRYIITTEIPDPYKVDRDIVLVVPIGIFLFENGRYFFCFEADDHE